jgi:hypothetical protein
MRLTKMVDKKRANKLEKIVAKLLGIKRVPMSGAGVQKEDLIDEIDFLGQLKSTSKASIKIERGDVKTLVKNCLISHRIPIFVIHFDCEEKYLKKQFQTWIMTPVDYVEDLGRLGKE